jgi:hypothetical protein
VRKKRRKTQPLLLICTISAMTRVVCLYLMFQGLKPTLGRELCPSFVRVAYIAGCRTGGMVGQPWLGIVFPISAGEGATRGIRALDRSHNDCSMFRITACGCLFILNGEYDNKRTQYIYLTNLSSSIIIIPMRRVFPQQKFCSVTEQSWLVQYETNKCCDCQTVSTTYLGTPSYDYVLRAIAHP